MILVGIAIDIAGANSRPPPADGNFFLIDGYSLFVDRYPSRVDGNAIRVDQNFAWHEVIIYALRDITAMPFDRLRARAGIPFTQRAISSALIAILFALTAVTAALIMIPPALIAIRHRQMIITPAQTAIPFALIAILHGMKRSFPLRQASFTGRRQLLNSVFNIL